MLKLDHKVVIGYTTINVIGVTTVFVKYPNIKTPPQKANREGEFRKETSSIKRKASQY